VYARQLFEERSSRLEEHGVGKDHDAAGGIQIHACSRQLHQVQTDQPHVDHIAGYSGDADAITYADAPSPHQEEIGRDGEENGLQANCEAGGDEAGKGSQRTELADKSEDEHDAHAKADHDTAQQEELPPPPQILDITEGDPAPYFGEQQDDADGEGNAQDPE
jgi:hypothetical protein